VDSTASEFEALNHRHENAPPVARRALICWLRWLPLILGLSVMNPYETLAGFGLGIATILVVRLLTLPIHRILRTSSDERAYDPSWTELGALMVGLLVGVGLAHLAGAAPDDLGPRLGATAAILAIASGFAALVVTLRGDESPSAERGVN
jgi:hypothetical protein